MLQVFSAGTPVSARDSGYDLQNGWDWYHVPGTTASHYPIEKRTRKAVLALRSQHGVAQRRTDRNYNSKTFVGGASLGEHGLFVQDLEALPFTAPTDLQGRKTYFFVGDRVLALGSAIRGGTSEDRTHTTIFQTRLDGPDTATWLDGRTLTGLDLAERKPAGTSAAMADSVGNSYFLASSTADLVLSRGLQRSMSEDYEPTEGAYAQAYLDHGTRPAGDSYEYVLIPADEGARKLQELAADPESYYRAIRADSIHLVHFPGQRVTGYAFYETVETPAGQLVRSASIPATVMVQEQDGSVLLAASVPDIGWQSDRRVLARGSGHAATLYARQKAKLHALELVLRGNWCPTDAPAGTETEAIGEDTKVTLLCTDGLSTRIALVSGDACR